MPIFGFMTYLEFMSFFPPQQQRAPVNTMMLCVQ